MSRKRRLDDEETWLWSDVTRGVKPLSNRPEPETVPEPAAKSARKQAKPKTPKSAPRPSAQIPPAKPPKPPHVPLPHAPGTLDGNLQRKLRRGRIEPDATLDLHGLTRDQAHARLQRDIPRLRGQGARCILVITGKGTMDALARHTLHGNDFSLTPERKGVIRASLPRWLAEHEFRPHVAGIRPAHPRHGGGGAFYVWLRRQR